MPLLFRLATVRPTVLPRTVPCWVSKVALLPVTVNALPACNTAELPVLLIARPELPAFTARLLLASTLPELFKAVFKFSVALPLDCSVPLLVKLLALTVPLAPALSASVSVPLLSTVSDVLVRPPLASSVPVLVNEPPIDKVMASLDCSVPALFNPLANVSPTVLPKTVPDCVPKVTLVPFTVNALPACSTAAAPVLLMVMADAPALTARLFVARTLPVLASAAVRFKSRLPADCSVPLLVSVASVNAPACPAALDAISVPALFRLLATSVVPAPPWSVPPAWLSMLVAFTVRPPSASRIPLLTIFSVPPPALSARSSVVLACRLPLLASVPLMRPVTLPASAVILPALVKPPPALRLKLPAVLCMPCAAPVAVVMLPVSAASVMLPAERTAAVPSARLLVVLKASVVPAYKVAPLLPIVRLLALPVKAPPAPHAVPLMLAAPVMARVLLPPAKRVLAAADASLKLAAVVVRLLAAYSSPSASLI